MNQILGQTITVRATFRDIAGDLVDPGTVTLVVRAPDGTTTTTNKAGLVNPSTGIYQLAVDLDQPGIWRWRFTGTTSEGSAICEDSVCVDASVLAGVS